MATDPLEVARDSVIAATQFQIDELDGTPLNSAQLALAQVDFDDLDVLAGKLPGDVKITTALKTLGDTLEAARKGTEQGALGDALINAHALRRLVDAQASTWVTGGQTTQQAVDAVQAKLAALIATVRQLLGKRPDVEAIMANLSAIKELSGGPADADAYHDFHVLSIAFKHVWLHAFDANLQTAAEELYEQLINAPADADVVTGPVNAISDLNDLKDVVKTLNGRSTTDEAVPPEVIAVFGEIATKTWSLMSWAQRLWVWDRAVKIQDPASTEEQKTGWRADAGAMFLAPDGYFGRLSRTLMNIDRALNEKYAFDVFATDSYNYGLLATYRQHWTPGPYQAGNLVATIPLAPGETRKFSKKHVIKKSRAQKEIEKAMSSRSDQASVTARAESEIMNKVDVASNFKMTSTGSFNIGIGSFSSTSEFGANQSQQSSQNKKAFQEATKKSAEEYRRERSIEIDSTQAEEWEETSTGEISNPNNEITVTYLFYELQRRYQIETRLNRVRPVILVAQDVPAPHEINEGWLIQHHWILSRVILDDMFKPALEYVASGLAGDEVSLEVQRGRWEKQKALVNKLETLVNTQLATRNALRELIVQQTLRKDKLDDAMEGLGLLDTLTDAAFAGDVTFSVLNKNAATAEDLEANRRAAETRLKYTEEALSDAQDKLRSAASAFDSATDEYAKVLRNKYSRGVAIDQLRVHVKENILYYMQAIWDHEPPDQRFFRLYNKKVICPKPVTNCQIAPRPVLLAPHVTAAINAAKGVFTPVGTVQLDKICAPSASGAGGVGGDVHDLIEVADLDNPLGYKGNYIIFPLKDDCYLTTFMLTEFLDEEMQLRDPDGTDDFNEADFEQRWNASTNNAAARAALTQELNAQLQKLQDAAEEIIVPTGQLFIEALPGAHPLLEDFKLLHRFEDVRKVRAEIRHAELENLRLASRLIEAGDHPELLSDPDISKKIVVSPGTNVAIGVEG